MSQEPTNTFTDDAEFIVRESKRANIVIGVFMLMLSAVVLYHIDTDYHSDQVPVYKTMLLLTLIPALVFIMKGYKHRLLFRVNRNGIYRYEKLLTSWHHFVAARITQEEITGSYTDNFILLVEFYKDNQQGAFIRKMKLPNTMDKSEEEIIEVIRYFSKFSANPIHPASENTNSNDA